MPARLTIDSLAGGMAIGYGDLFPGSPWMPYGSSPCTGDDTCTGTTWSFGFLLDDHWVSEGTRGTGMFLYSE